MPVTGPKEHTPEWLALHEQYDPERERPVVFGASQAAAACGQSPYKTPLDLYMEYRGLKPRRENKAELATRLRRGLKLQPVILSEYEHETGLRCIEPHHIFFHDQHSFMAASPDALTPALGPPVEVGRLVEIKASNPRMLSTADDEAEAENRYGKDGTDWVPTDVLFQTQQQMAVMDCELVDVVVWFGLWQMKIYPVHRNETIIDAIVSAERELAERIVNEDPPEPNWSHTNTKRLLSELYGYRSGDAVELSGDVADMWCESVKLGKAIKDLQERREELRNRVLAELAGAELGNLPGGAARVKRIRVAEKEVTPQPYVRPAYEYLRETKRK